jgi:hypothetical protein
MSAPVSIEPRLGIQATPRADDSYLPLRELAGYSGLSIRTLRQYLTHASPPCRTTEWPARYW